MLVILLFIGPGLISSAIQCWLEKVPYRSFQFFINFLIYTFIIQCFVFIILFLRGHGANTPESVFDSIGNVAKYGVISILAAILFPGIISFLRRFKRTKR